MPEIKERLQKAGINIIMSYIEKDPEKNLEKLLDGFDLFSNGSFAVQRKYFRKFLIDNPDSNWRKLAMRVLKEMHPRVLNKLVANFFLNANMIGWKKQEELRNKYNCNIPWAILLRLNLSYEDIDSIIRQGKELGVYFYIYTGGEPLVRKKDIIRLCEEHDDCIFLSFTNGTLIDEAFANAMLRVGNFIPAISVEGFEEATDGRRGAGTFEKATGAMEILRSKRLPFGISACYTSQNLESITSEAFYDQTVAWGAYFIWYFHYMPVGKDAVPELSRRKTVSAYQRERRRRSLRVYSFFGFQHP